MKDFPDFAEFERLDFRQLMDRVGSINPADLDPQDLARLRESSFCLVLSFTFRDEFLAHCQTLTSEERVRCVEILDSISSWPHTYGTVSRRNLTLDRIYLSVQVLLETGPLPEVALTDPARLLRPFLDGLPYSVAEAERRVDTRRAALYKALSEPMTAMIHLRRVEHLFAPSPDLDEYRAWQDLWSRVTGIPESTYPRGPEKGNRQGQLRHPGIRRRVIPDSSGLVSLTFRQLMDRVWSINLADLDREDPVLQREATWFMLEFHFRVGLHEQWSSLTSQQLQRCAEIIDRISSWTHTYGGVPRWRITPRRFYLFAQFLLEAGPRPEIPLTDPARLLRTFLDGFPYLAAEAEQKLDTRRDELVNELDRPMLPIGAMRRVEHLFPPSPDLDEYRAWQDLWARVTGIPESAYPRGPEKGKRQGRVRRPWPRLSPIPDTAELVRLDFRQLMDLVWNTNQTDLDRQDPVLLHNANWIMFEERLRNGFLKQWDTVTDQEWQRCGEIADRLWSWAETYGGVSRWSITDRRFHLFTQLLLTAGPRPEVPLTDPARLLWAFLDGFPYPVEEADRRADTQRDELVYELAEATGPLSHLRRVEHLFPPSSDLDEYRAWQDLWARVTGVPESDRPPWPRGDVDFRQLMDWVDGFSTAELDRADPERLRRKWSLLEDRFRFGFINNWRTLTNDEWRRCGKLADRIYAWAATYDDILFLNVAHRRFHLFVQLLLEAGPRPEVPLTDPARLLRAFLDRFPYSVDEADRQQADTRRADLAEPMESMDQISRVEHLFAPSADLDEYRAWQDLWSRDH